MTITTKFNTDDKVFFKHKRFGLLQGKIIDMNITVYNPSHVPIAILYRVFFTIDDYCDYSLCSENQLLKTNFLKEQI